MWQPCVPFCPDAIYDKPEACSASGTHSEGLPLSLIFCMAVFHLRVQSAITPLFQYCMLEVMNEKEIRKAKVGGVESIGRRHIIGCFIIYSHIMEMDFFLV